MVRSRIGAGLIMSTRADGGRFWLWGSGALRAYAATTVPQQRRPGRSNPRTPGSLSEARTRVEFMASASASASSVLRLVRRLSTPVRGENWTDPYFRKTP